MHFFILYAVDLEGTVARDLPSLVFFLRRSPFGRRKSFLNFFKIQYHILRRYLKQEHESAVSQTMQLQKYS
jgi:hypothetical protein